MASSKKKCCCNVLCGRPEYINLVPQLPDTLIVELTGLGPVPNVCIHRFGGTCNSKRLTLENGPLNRFYSVPFFGWGDSPPITQFEWRGTYQGANVPRIRYRRYQGTSPCATLVEEKVSTSVMVRVIAQIPWPVPTPICQITVEMSFFFADGTPEDAFQGTVNTVPPTGQWFNSSVWESYLFENTRFVQQQGPIVPPNVGCSPIGDVPWTGEAKLYAS